MKISPPNFLLVCLGLLMSSSPLSAADEQFCTDYVLVSISQYWKSVDAHCNFTGARWNAQYDAQLEWCLSAHQWVAENETANRQQMLDECIERQADSTMVLEKQADIPPSGQADKSLDELLLQAVATDDVERAKLLYEQGASLNFVTDDPKLIRQYDMAATMGSGIVIQGEMSAVEVSGNVVDGAKQQDTHISESLLSYAVSKGLVNTGLWLLEQQKISLGTVQYERMKRNLLGRALVDVAKSHQDSKYSVDELLRLGTDINFDLDDNFGTPLHFAVTAGNAEMIKSLLANGANPRYATNGGPNMLNFALDNPSILKMLLNAGANPNLNGEASSRKELPLNKAVTSKRIEALHLLLKHGADPNYADFEVAYPLIEAVRNDDLSSVKVLLKYGAKPNLVYNAVSPGECRQDAENIVPLSVAMEAGAAEIISVLKQEGAKTSKEICGE